MADVARNLDPRAVEPRKLEREEQYWSPSLDRRPMTASEIESCPRCGTDFIIGSRFCYVCGSDRDLPGKARRSSGIEWKRWLDIRELPKTRQQSIFRAGIAAKAGLHHRSAFLLPDVYVHWMDSSCEK